MRSSHSTLLLGAPTVPPTGTCGLEKSGIVIVYFYCIPHAVNTIPSLLYSIASGLRFNSLEFLEAITTTKKTPELMNLKVMPGRNRGFKSVTSGIS